MPMYDYSLLMHLELFNQCSRLAIRRPHSDNRTIRESHEAVADRLRLCILQQATSFQVFATNQMCKSLALDQSTGLCSCMSGT